MGISETRRYWTKKVVIYVLGIIVMTFGISMSIRASIGVAPGSAIPYSVSLITPLTIGLSASLFHIFCVILQLAVTRRFSLQVALQLPMAYIFGFLIDLFYDMLEMEFVNLAHNILILTLAMFIFSLGIRAIVGANLLLAPPDGLAQTLGKMVGWPMSKAKLAFDIVVTAAAALLTFIVTGNPLLVIGIGTVICAIGTGPIIGLFTKLLPFLDVKKSSSGEENV